MSSKRRVSKKNTEKLDSIKEEDHE